MRYTHLFASMVLLLASVGVFGQSTPSPVVRVCANDASMGSIALTSASGWTGSGTTASPYTKNVTARTSFEVVAAPNPGYKFVRWEYPLVTFTPSGGSYTVISCFSFTGIGYTGAQDTQALKCTQTKESSFPIAGSFSPVWAYAQASPPYFSGFNVAPGGTITAVFAVDPNRIPVTFTFGNLEQVYDGATKSATIAPSVAGATYTSSLSGGPGAGNYAVTATATAPYAGSGSATLKITKAGQTITFPNPGVQVFGTALALNASASSGLTVSYAVASGPAEISDSTVNFTGTGSVTITASQTGSADYNAANTVSRTFTVGACPVDFRLSSNSFTYNGRAQGPTVVSTPVGATFTAGGILSATGSGSYTATATATGSYTGSNSVLAWTITKAEQTITFPNPGAQSYGTSLTLSATASSGLAVSYAVTSGPATISGNTVSFTGTGSVTITASQTGNADYNAASAVSRTFAVGACPVSFCLSSNSFTYSGSVQGPTVIPTPRGATFTTVGTLSAIAAGTYTATATATGNYSGENLALTWKIILPAEVAPVAPVSLQGLGGSTQVTLSWSSSGSGVARYEIRRGGVLVGTAAGAALGYTDTTVSPLTSYTYSVRAVGTNGLSSDDSTVTVATVAPLEVFTPTR